MCEEEKKVEYKFRWIFIFFIFYGSTYLVHKAYAERS